MWYTRSSASCQPGASDDDEDDNQGGGDGPTGCLAKDEGACNSAAECLWSEGLCIDSIFSCEAFQSASACNGAMDSDGEMPCAYTEGDGGGNCMNYDGCMALDEGACNDDNDCAFSGGICTSMVDIERDDAAPSCSVDADFVIRNKDSCPGGTDPTRSCMWVESSGYCSAKTDEVEQPCAMALTEAECGGSCAWTP